MSKLVASLDPALVGRDRGESSAGHGLTASQGTRRFGPGLGLLTCVLLAGCELVPFEPDVDVNLAQVSGLELKLARVIEPGDVGIANPAGLAYSPGRASSWW